MNFGRFGRLEGKSGRQDIKNASFDSIMESHITLTMTMI
jgi:hypothetical protein